MKFRILTFLIILGVPAFGQAQTKAVDNKPRPQIGEKMSVERQNTIGTKVKQEKEANVVKQTVPSPAKKNIKFPKKKNVVAHKQKIEKKQVKSALPSIKTDGENISADKKFYIELNEGNFKYRRIPGIILTENRASSLELSQEKVLDKDVNLDEENILGNSKKDGKKDFWFLGKTVAKVGVLLLILLIFFLYRSRSRGASGKRSKRNVLNSYRK